MTWSHHLTKARFTKFYLDANPCPELSDIVRFLRIFYNLNAFKFFPINHYFVLLIDLLLMRINQHFFLLLALSFLLLRCSQLNIVQKPITFDEERKQLSLEYLEKRYGIVKEEASIEPQMVVVHYTVIPTMEKTYQAFYGSQLPGFRTAIKGASALNVSSQYLIDRDGTVYQLLPDTVFARHVIGLNHCAIGIENVADGGDLPMTQKQLVANTRLIKQLAEKYPIEYVIGHHEYQQFRNHELWKETDANYLTEKSDPGDEFMERLRKKLDKLGLKELPGN